MLRPAVIRTIFQNQRYLIPKDLLKHNSFISKACTMTSVSNPKIASPVPTDYTKQHHLPNGKFQNPWPSWSPMEPLRLIKWMLSTFGEKTDTKPPNTIPVVQPTFTKRDTSRTKLRATWLGHACYFVEFPGGLNVLFDPVLCYRCSPFTFMGPARYTKAPLQIEDDILPEVDAVVISHSHYDHLSLTDVKKIAQKYPNAHFFVPLGNKEWFLKTKITNVSEMDWWETQEIHISLDTSDQAHVEGAVHCCPAQHTSGRTLFDRDRTLWSSWAVSSGGKSVYFAGDTGYRHVPLLSSSIDDYGEEYKNLPHCPAFKQIGELRGPFDLGLIPIGAYEPRVIMSSVHANPFDSVNIFQDTKCKKALAMHYGTWLLTFEPVLDPIKKLNDAKKRYGVPDEDFIPIDIGESREY